MTGIDFIEMQLAKRCNCRHLALMSGDFSNEDEEKAKELGLKFFKKPIELPEVFEWLDKIEHHNKPAKKIN